MAAVRPLVITTTGQARPYSAGAGDSLTGAGSSYPVAPSGGSYTTAAAGSNAVALGDGASAPSASSIAVGVNALTTAANQLVAGSVLAPINVVVIGAGESTTTLVSATVTHRATRIATSETDESGQSVVWQAGAGTGAAAVSTISFETPTATTTGTAQQALAARLSISESAVNVSNSQLQTGGFPVPVVLSVTSVDLGAVATTNLYTVPTGKTAIITDAVLKPTTATAAVGDAVVGIGVAAGEDDIFSSQTLTGLNLTTERFKFLSSGVSVTAAAAAVIKAGVDTADTGTALVANVYLIGYLI